MLKHHWRFISRIERILDSLIVVGAFLLTYYARDHIVLSANAFGASLELLKLGALKDYLLILGLALPLFSAYLAIFGGYRSMRFSSAWKIVRLSVLSSSLVFLSIGSILFLMKLDLSRSFVALFCGLSGAAILTERIFVLAALRYWRVRGRNFRNVLIVGTGVQARKLYLEIAQQPELGVRVVGFVTIPREGQAEEGARLMVNGHSTMVPLGSDSATYDLPARVVANPQSFEAALKRYAVDEVLFTDVVKAYSTVQDLAQIAVEEGVRVTLAADIFSLEIFKSEMSYFGSIPLIHYQPSPGDSSALAVKRLIDLGVSALLLVVLSPLMVLTALLIRLETPGPVFFRQRRVGLNGRLFTLYKFRSMVVGAERMLDELKDLNEMKGPVFKITNDPRVTSVGRWIRRLSIDETPQLWNVLRGDMSLVGPRPPLPSEVSLYERKQRRRLSMRPGLTCIWQVSGRNNIPDFQKWAELDLEYIDNWSLGQDLGLLIRTIPVVLFGFGAK